MATATWNLVRDTTTAGGAVDLGNGADQHAPMGLWSGYVYRHFAKYDVDTSAMGAITAATLHMRATTQVHVAFGSSPTIVCSRLTSSFTGSGGSEGSWSGSAVPKDSTQPSATSTGQTTTNMTEVESAWDTIDVTAIAQAWLAGNTNYGVRLKALSEASTADTWEGYAQASSYDSYITVTYTPTVTVHPPVASPVRPLDGEMGDMSYPGASGWATPRPTLQWSFSDPDAGAAQSAYQVIVYNNAAGVPGTTLYDSGKVLSSATSLVIPATFAEGNYYYWQVQVWDNTDLVSAAYTAIQRFRVRWGKAEYYGDLGAVPAAWGLDTLNTTGTVTVEYNSSTNSADPGAGLGAWVADIASVTKQQFVRFRAWLLPNGGVAPALNKLVFSYSTAVASAPDSWTLSAHAVADTATQVYGVRSLRIDAIGADERTYQQVTVLPNTTYQLSGRIKQSLVGVNPFIALSTVPTGATGEVAVVPGSNVDTDWNEVSVAWDSGSSTSIYIQCGASGTGSAWFDALKLEASDTVTPWMPSVVGIATAIDAAGIKVDGSTGGTVRFRGTAGGVADLVSLGAHGLMLGAVGFSSGPAFPTSPAVGERWFRTDLGMDFYHDGTQWLSSQLFTHLVGDRIGPANAASLWHNGISVTTASAQRAGAPPAMGGSDWYIVDCTTTFFVSGGTALSASHQWVCVLSSINAAAGAIATLATVTINSGSINVFRHTTTAVNALLSALAFALQTTWTKTGTPGGLLMDTMLTYRIVAT